MPVQSEMSRVQYAGNGSDVTPYAVPFYFLDNADVAVVLKDPDGVETRLVEAVDYVLTGAALPEGGELTTLAPYDASHALAVFREPEALQLAEFQGTGPLPADTITRGLDKLTMLVQSLQRKLLRSLRLTDASQEVEAVAEGSRAGTVVGFDGLGAAKLYDTASLMSLLSLQGSLQEAPTAFWSDNGERAVKVPDFAGQVGVQMNEGSLWIATATTAGSWAAQVLDEDDLASDSDRQAPTQQSVKAYVDAGIAAAVAEAVALDAAYLPPGVVVPFCGASAPGGWLLCHGQAVSRATYAGLFAAVSTTYGVGDGSTTFNLPDLRGRVVAGKDDMGGTAAGRLTNSGTGNPGINGTTLGAAGGVDRHTLTTAQMPSHTHAAAAGSFALFIGAGGGLNLGGAGNATNGITAAAGSSEAHPNVQPTMVLNYIIRI